LFLIFLSIRCSDVESKPISIESVKEGEVLFNSVGCTKCHSVTGESMYGPSLNFILNKDVIIFRKGKKKSVKLDRKYIIRSITNPDLEKLNGYQEKKMPSVSLSPEDIDRIADYLIYINSKKNAK